MMKLNVKNVDVWNVVECEDEFDVDGSELKKSGMYRFECGSRGVLESVEYLGDVDEIEVEDVDDVNKMYVELYKDEDDVSEEDVKNIVDEWYVCEEMDGIVVDSKKCWVVGWNEEDSVCYVKVNVEEKFVKVDVEKLVEQNVEQMR